MDLGDIKARIDKSSIPVPECGCLIWLGALSNSGYGCISVDGKMQRVHRFAWIVAKGPIPDGLHVLHKCDTRLCINTDHLFLGTHTDNMKDKMAKGRGNHPFGLRNGRHTQPHKTSRGVNHYWHKHPELHRGANNPQAKLTPQQVLQIRAWRGSQASASRHFRVSTSTINRIVLGTHWKYV